MSDMTDLERAWLGEVGMRLRLARVRRRLSQREAAAIAELSSVTLGSIERADHVAGVLAYVRAARAVGLSLDELLPDAP